MWWLVFEQNGTRYVWIEEAGNIMSARLKASLAGHADGFVEGHQLTAAMVRKVPKSALRKRLDDTAARRLLEKLG